MEKELKILFFVSEDWYYWSHRRSIAFEALSRCYRVVLVTRVNELKDQIESTGVCLIPSRLERSSINPFRELITLLELVRIYRREKPDIVHHVALKPVLYGTWAGRITGVPGIVNAFGGLGHLFTSDSWLDNFLKGVFTLVMRVSFKAKNIRVILQNPVDIQQLVSRSIIDPSKTVLIRGAGANLQEFSYKPEPDGLPIIMYAGRFLWSKGVGDFIEAADILYAQGMEFKAVLVGRPDPENPESITEDTLTMWDRKPQVELWGYREDMAAVLASSAVVILPSKYGEGVPKILIEAAAVGRPIIATDIPGCREIVRQEWNGLLIEPDNPRALGLALAGLLKDQELRIRMGKNGRKLVEEQFSERLMLDQTFSVYEELIK